MRHIPLTIIVPAKHEEHSIVQTLDVLHAHVKTPHRIIVVNVSDTKDRTADLAFAYRRTYPELSIIRTIHPKGTFGMAIQTGLRAVKTDIVVPFMADGCDDPMDIDRMYRKLIQGWDVVCASRYMPGGKKIGGPRVQSLFSYLVCKTLQRMTGVPTSDVSNAFKMYKKSALRAVHINPKSGVEASMDILLQTYVRGAKITEIPTIWRGRTAGHSKFHMMERISPYLRIYVWAIRQALNKNFTGQTPGEI